jgi:cyclophilin family peptidyl-prolyl cis-trans isomerase/FKBP-type peptidyl-prolyl cis-trans isomerase 2/thiol-disulfide isomerase/thioredoxin
MFKKIVLLLLTALVFAGCSVKAPDSDPNIDLKAQNWKKTYVWFVASWCPHCQEEVPVLDKFYRDFKNDVNMQLIVIDKKRFNWDYIIPQDSNSSLTYEQSTGESCEYVPSYVIYDENKNIISKKCGWKLTYDELKEIFIPNQSNDSMTNSWNTDSSSWNTISSSWNTISNSWIIDTSYQLAPLKDNDIVATLTTSNWTIKIKLFPEDAPKTVTNFIWLAKKWYYNWLIFHRVIKNFMIQWWDPKWNGTWWESFFWWEFEDEFSPKLTNLTGALSMANAWANTNGSQFFINEVNNAHLNWIHSVFGQVVEWLDNVDKIANVKVDKNEKPVKEVKLIKVEINKYSSGKLVNYEFDADKELKKIEEAKKAKEEANKNRVVKEWDEVSVNYILKLADTWKEYDNSYKRGTPLEFKVWAKQMIPWFENWIIGMKIGEKKTLNIKSKDAYWEYKESNIQSVPRTELKQFEDNWIELKVWNKLPTMYWEFEIKEVTKDTVKIDLNPPLAWKDLIFDVELVWFKN